MDSVDRAFTGDAEIAQHGDKQPAAVSNISRPLRILVLTQVHPDQVTNGTALRVKPLLAGLSSHQITLLCADGFAPAPAAKKGTLRRLLGMANFSQPYSFQPEFHAAVNAAVSSQRFDVLLLCGAEMLQYIPTGAHAIVADLVDEPVLAALRNLCALSGWEKITMVKHSLSLLLYERRWQNRLSAVMVVAPLDAKSARRVMPNVLVREVANGVNADYFRPRGLTILPHEIVFSGNMAFPPNIAACLWFADQVFPLIRQVQPEAHWTIVGSQPHASVQRLSGPGITVTGWVSDIRPYIEQAAVYVSPLVSGGGIKNKILEAWAMQKAVVATQLGCAGVAACDGSNLYIADDPCIFAEKTISLLHDPQLAARLGSEARRCVETSYRWTDKAAELESLLCSTAAGGIR